MAQTIEIKPNPQAMIANKNGIKINATNALRRFDIIKYIKHMIMLIPKK